MRCCCCQRNLNDWESTAKTTSGEYLDTCNTCLKGSGIPVVGRPDLVRNEAAPSDWLDLNDVFLDNVNNSYFENDQ